MYWYRILQSPSIIPALVWLYMSRPTKRPLAPLAMFLPVRTGVELPFT
jgi:hypothetical protein